MTGFRLGCGCQWVTIVGFFQSGASLIRSIRGKFPQYVIKIASFTVTTTVPGNLKIEMISFVVTSTASVTLLWQSNVTTMTGAESGQCALDTYGTRCNFSRRCYHRNRPDPNKRWPSIGICRCHISADNRRSNAIVHSHTIAGIDSAPRRNYTNDPVRHCHPYNSHVNCRIRIRASIHHCRNGKFPPDNCK